MVDEITGKVMHLIAAVKKIPEENVTTESTFEQLGLDSLDAINLIYEIEGEFNISVPDDVARSIKDVQQLVAVLKANLTGDTTYTGT
ncbi:MAG: phosphopantetheine-binding protein [Candidatus Angelobacter sp. Gp1-AA117]|nr:MAG: phosphopantetheine-binding protein [Candidatus Angelobacter sp. Gp1-AA117]